MLLTKSSAFLIGPVASLLGYIMDAIYWLQSQIGLENIGLCIILFTVVIYLLMTPLTIQQQRFSRLSSRMNPEIQAIQKKYKGKNQDQAAMARMNEETQAVYTKYGVNPMGSCLQLIIQMPILFALYQVIWNVPAYVSKVRDAFIPLAEALIGTNGAQEYLTQAASSLNVSFKEMTNLTVVDVLYKFRPSNWTDLAQNFPGLADTITSTQAEADRMNYFLGLNIADAPLSIITSAFQAGAFLMVIGALMIPILSAVTQWLNAKLMSSVSNAAANSDENNTMAGTMKTMNTVMPIMSAVFCLTLPVGMGVYWIAGAVIRSIQQVVINRHLDKMDLDELMKKNMEKLNKKREKRGLPPQGQKTSEAARMSTRNISVNNSSYVKRYEGGHAEAGVKDPREQRPQGKAGKSGSKSPDGKGVQRDS